MTMIKKEIILNHLDKLYETQKTYQWENDLESICPFDSKLIKNTTWFIVNLGEKIIEKLNINDIMPTPNGTIEFLFYKEDKTFTVEIGNNYFCYYINPDDYHLPKTNQKNFDILSKDLKTFYIF